MMDPWQMSGHGVIVGLLVYIIAHIRSIKITMKNGKDENGNN